MDTFSAAIPTEVAKLLSELDVLRGIPVGHKFNIITSTYSSTWSIWDKLIRYSSGESGTRTIEYINTLLDRAIKLGQQYPNYTKTIISRVASLEQAMSNLYNSYQGQPVVQGEISVIRLRICSQAFENAIKEEPKPEEPT